MNKLDIGEIKIGKKYRNVGSDEICEVVDSPRTLPSEVAYKEDWRPENCYPCFTSKSVFAKYWEEV